MARVSRRRPRGSLGEAYYRPLTPEALPREPVRRDELATQVLPTSDTVYPWYQSRVLQRGVIRGFVARPLRSLIPSVLSFDREAAPRAQRRRAMQLSVSVPSRVRFCVQRKQRREVLFALRRAGYSGSARKRSWYRSENSNWRC